MSIEIIIREMNIYDYDEVIKLWDMAGLSYRPLGRDSKDNIEKELNASKSIFLLAQCGREIIGSVLGTNDGRKGWINRLAVLPSFRRKGISLKLISELERRFSELNINITACLIEDWNEVSLSVLEKTGYKLHKDIFYLSKRKSEKS